MSGHVFISYSHDDRDDAERLVSIFEQFSVPIWWDKVLEAGRKFTPEIEEAIKTCGAALLLLSETFLESEYIWEKEIPAIHEAMVSMIAVSVKEPFAGHYRMWANGMKRTAEDIGKTKDERDASAAKFELTTRTWPIPPEEGPLPRGEDGQLDRDPVLDKVIPRIWSALESAKSDEWFRGHFAALDPGSRPEALWVARTKGNRDAGSTLVYGMVEPSGERATFRFRPEQEWTGGPIDLSGEQVRTTVSPKGDLAILETPGDDDRGSALAIRALADEAHTFETDLPPGAGPVLACWRSGVGRYVHLICADGTEWAYDHRTGVCICIGTVLGDGTRRLVRLALDGVVSIAWIDHEGALVGDGPADFAAPFAETAAEGVAEAAWIDLDAAVWTETTRWGTVQRVLVVALANGGELYAMRGVATSGGSVGWEEPISRRVRLDAGIETLRVGRIRFGGDLEHLVLRSRTDSWFTDHLFDQGP